MLYVATKWASDFLDCNDTILCNNNYVVCVAQHNTEADLGPSAKGGALNPVVDFWGTAF